MTESPTANYVSKVNSWISYKYAAKYCNVASDYITCNVLARTLCCYCSLSRLALAPSPHVSCYQHTRDTSCCCYRRLRRASSQRMLTQPSVLPAAMHHGTRVVYTELKGPSLSRLSHEQILSSTPPPPHTSTTPPLLHLFTDTELFILQFPIS